MIIYNITVKVDHSIHEQWLNWLKTPIARMMGSGLFLDYRICRLLQQDDHEGRTYALQFTLSSMEEYEQYQRAFAPVLQEEYGRYYRDKYVCFRTLMEVL